MARIQPTDATVGSLRHHASVTGPWWIRAATAIAGGIATMNNQEIGVTARPKRTVIQGERAITATTVKTALRPSAARGAGRGRSAGHAWRTIKVSRPERKARRTNSSPAKLHHESW